MSGESDKRKKLNIKPIGYNLSLVASRFFIYKKMDINTDYLRGLVDTTIEFYELTNGRIPADKQMTVRYEIFTGSHYVVGCKIVFTYKLTVSSKWDIDSELEENWIKIYEKDSISGVVSDITDILSDIHLKTLNYL